MGVFCIWGFVLSGFFSPDFFPFLPSLFTSNFSNSCWFSSFDCCPQKGNSGCCFSFGKAENGDIFAAKSQPFCRK